MRAGDKIAPLHHPVLKPANLPDFLAVARSGRVRRKELIYTRLGRLEERWPSAWSYLKEVTLTDTELVWRWDRKKLRSAWFHQGAYLLRTNLLEHDPERLWGQYTQLTELESVFRTLKSELNLRPIFHRIQSRVEAHILIAFLGYCLWVCLKQKTSFPRWQFNARSSPAHHQGDPYG
jgi:hypothetical protein